MQHSPTKHPICRKKYFPILQTSDRSKKAIPTLPMAALHRPKNLRDSLVQSSASRRDTVGSKPCNIPRCMKCTLITSSTTFTSKITRKSYSILHNLSCHSHNVIYLITCNLCSKQYVGLTSKTLCKWFNTHRFNINNDRGDAVAKHFNFPGHTISHSKITPIDQLLTADMIGLQNKETFWIHTLQNHKVSTSTTKQRFQSHKSIKTPNFLSLRGATLDLIIKKNYSTREHKRDIEKEREKKKEREKGEREREREREREGRWRR